MSTNHHRKDKEMRLKEDKEIFEYEDSNPKRINNELSVDFIFPNDISKDEAVKFITEQLENYPMDWTIDIWTTPNDM